MKRSVVVVAGFLIFALCSMAHAEYSVWNTGMWPNSWPKELEPLRKQARTFEGPVVLNQHYAIRFTKRDEFESAWPYIVQVKSKGASLRLVHGPNFFLGDGVKAGVVIHSPPRGQDDKPTYIELVVDGEIIDLNRIALPPDTTIIDERFKDETKKQR